MDANRGAMLQVTTSARCEQWNGENPFPARLSSRVSLDFADLRKAVLPPAPALFALPKNGGQTLGNLPRICPQINIGPQLRHGATPSILSSSRLFRLCFLLFHGMYGPLNCAAGREFVRLFIFIWEAWETSGRLSGANPAPP